ARPARCAAPPPPRGLRLATGAAGVLGVAAVVCLFTALPAWRAGRLGVLEAIALRRTSIATKPSRLARAPPGPPARLGCPEPIALGRTSIATKPSRLARAAVALHMPPAVVLGVKDAFASRSRALLTSASLALTMMTVVFALGTEATYRRVIEDSSLRAKPYELLVSA